MLTGPSRSTDGTVHFTMDMGTIAGGNKQTKSDYRNGNESGSLILCRGCGLRLAPSVRGGIRAVESLSTTNHSRKLNAFSEDQSR